ncbi:MAG: hypothetical protein KGQ52_02210 [Alphaproteobacteria bacterium]|nr:hypothetical protein [Alphaproteobacteria bacterium]
MINVRLLQFGGRRAHLGLLLAATLAGPAIAAPADEEIAVTAERLNRSVLRAEAERFVRKAVADTRNNQNARFMKPLCVESIGVTAQVGSIFITRVTEVARHVGLAIDKPGCAPNLVLVFTRDAAQLIKTIGKRNSRVLDGLPGPDRAVLKRPGLPVRWWHHTAPEASDGRQFAPAGFGIGGVQGDVTYNNYARASRIDEPSRVAITGAVVVVDIGLVGAVTPAALSDYIALVGLSRVRMEPANRPTPSILQLFDPGGAAIAGFSPQDELFIESLYRTRANLTGAQQRAAMAGYIADEAVKATSTRAK